MAVIISSQGRVILVDAADHQWLSQWKWSVTNSGYAIAAGGTLMHRLITGAGKGEVVDHLNDDPLDNRRCNLRVCTPRENLTRAARRRHARSQYKGVTWVARDQRWWARLTSKHSGRRVSLGYFENEEDAARAYDAAARAQYGQYARCNFAAGQ